MAGPFAGLYNGRSAAAPAVADAVSAVPFFGPPTRALAMTPTADTPSGKANILLVDDRPENLVALEAILSDLGQNLVTVRSGDEALRRLLHRDFAVVLLDVQMQGLDGFETARLIRGRERSRHTPIIFLTVYESPEFPDYLIKPVVPVILRAKVAVFVELFRKTQEVKRQAEQLRQAEQEQAERRTLAQYVTAGLLAESATLADAAPKVLRVLGESLGWDAAVLWTVDRPAQRLRCDELWHSPSVDLGELETIKRQVPLQPGEGLPGRVWAAGAPAWVEDVTADPTFPQAPLAARAGLHGACAVPIRLGGEVLGVLEFFSRGLQRRDEDLLPVLAGIGNQVGQFLERQRAAEALRLLAEASAVLGASLDYQATLEQFARLTVPRLADWCQVDLVAPGGGVRPLAVAHADPAKVELAWELARRYPWDPAGAEGIAKVARTGQAELYADVSDALLEAVARDAEHLRLLRGLGFRSGMCVPLAARGRTLGVVSFGSAESGRRYGPADLALAEELTRRAGLAVDNARLYEEAQEGVKARDRFLSIASHELRTPLNPLGIHVQLLLRAARDGTLAAQAPEKVLTVLETCDRQVRRFGQLVHDLLDITRIGVGRLDLHLEEVDLAAMTRDLAARFGPELAEAGCPLTLRADAAAVGRWDRLRLEQVAANLLSNAAKYGRGRPVEVSVEANGKAARLTVRDQGIGVAPEDQERIFERFERAAPGYEYGGLGMGLYIVGQIVQALGGSVWVESAPGEGAAFTVELPVAGPPA